MTETQQETAEAPSDELTELRRRVSELELVLGKSIQRSEKIEQKLQAAWAQVAWFHRQMFGRKSERVSKAELDKAWRAFVKEQEETLSQRGVPSSALVEPTSTSLQLLLDFMGHRGFGSAPQEERATSEALPPAESVEPADAKGPASTEDEATSAGPEAAAPSGTSPPPKKNKNRSRHGRSRLSEEMPTIKLQLDPEEVRNAGPGKRLVGAEVSYRLAVQKAQLVRVAIVRNTYAVDRDDGSTDFFTAEPPEEMVPRGLFSPSGLAHIIAHKWDRSVPYHRFPKFFDADGYRISKSTLSGTVIRAAPLAKDLVDAMIEHARQVAPYVGIDASGARVLGKKNDSKSYFWTRYVEDVGVFVDITDKHDAETVRDLLQGWTCATLADGASVYDPVVREYGLLRAGCFSHGRRKFVYAAPTDSRALVGVHYINQLFAIERKLVDCSAAERLEHRARESKPVVDQLFRWRDHLLTDASLAPRGLLAKALRYLRNQEPRLILFLSDGAVPIHNNDTELQIRHYAVGRKSWLFHGSEAGAEAAETWLSLVLSARMHDLAVEPYFRDLFRLLPIWPKRRILELAPHRWSATRARLDLEQLRPEFGPIDIPPVVDV